jgi:integrase
MHHLTREELKSLFKEVPNKRQRLMLLTGFWHGLRVSELISLLPTDMKDGYVNVQRLKGSLRTIQPFVRHEDPDLDEATPLKELLSTLGPNDRLFPMTRDGVRKLVKRAGKRAGIPAHKLHPHILKTPSPHKPSRQRA